MKMVLTTYIWMGETVTEPVIIFTLNSKTITVAETPIAFSTTSFTTSSTTSTKTTSTQAQATSFTTRSTSSSSAHDVTTSSKPAVPSSCICSTTTISDLSGAQSLGKACRTFKGSIVIPSEVSGPIDLSGMEKLVGDLSCKGSASEAFGALSGRDMIILTGNLDIQSNRFLSNVSFPAMIRLGSMNIVNNSHLSAFDSMSVLSNTTNSVYMNGSFSKVSFPELEVVPGPFILSSSVQLDCNLVAPNMCPQLSGQFSCNSANNSRTQPGGNIVYLPGGFTLKDKVIVSSIVGFLALVCMGIGLYCWIYRQTMKNTIHLAKETVVKKRAHKRAISQAGLEPFSSSGSRASMPSSPVIPKSPGAPSRSVGVIRPANRRSSHDPDLYAQLQALNQKANAHGLTPHEQDRRMYLSQVLIGQGDSRLQPTIPKLG